MPRRCIHSPCKLWGGLFGNYFDHWINFMIDCSETREIGRVASLNSEKVSLKCSIFICLFKCLCFSSPPLTSLIVYLVFFPLSCIHVLHRLGINKQTINQSVRDLTSKRTISRWLHITTTTSVVIMKMAYLTVDSKIANISGENKSIKITRNTSIHINNVKNTLKSNKTKMKAVNKIIKTLHVWTYNSEN